MLRVIRFALMQLVLQVVKSQVVVGIKIVVVNRKRFRMDFVVRRVDSRRFIPIILVDGVEKYRGEFKSSPQEALEKCVEMSTKVS